MNLYSYLAQFQVPAEVNRSVDIFCIFATQVRNANVKQQDVSQGKMEGFFTLVEVFLHSHKRQTMVSPFIVFST